MKNHAIYLFVAVLFFSGCITLQKPIDDVLLGEKTTEESAKIEGLEQKIIAKKSETDKVKKELAIEEQRIKVSKALISKIDKTEALLQEEEKLYTLSEDKEKLVKTQSEIEKCKKNDKQANTHLKYNKAKQNEKNALLQVKKAELAVLVAELDYEKAKIAKKYQLKRPEKFGKDIIDEQKYEKYLNDQKEKLSEKQKKYSKTLDLLNQADEEQKKTGNEAKV